MPVVPSSAYVTVEAVLNLARTLINDALVTIGGEVLTDTAPFTFPMLNSAALYAEMELANRGVETFVKETILGPLVAMAMPGGAPLDPGTQVNLSDTGYFNGNINFNPPQLPTDLLEPLALWERQSTSTTEWTPFGSDQQWLPVTQMQDGMPSVVQGPRFNMWEWRQDAIYLPGAIQSNDLRLRYQSQGLQFVLPSDSVQIRGGTNMLANLLAAIFTHSRNPMMAQTFGAAGDKMIDQIATMSTRQKSRVTQTRQAYGRSWRGVSPSRGGSGRGNC